MAQFGRPNLIARGSVLPNIGLTILMPEPFSSSTRVRRLHNKVSKEAGKDVMLEHWRETMPKHFRATNRQRYKHVPRDSSYKVKKLRRYKSRTDLVKTGETKARMTMVRPKIQIGGSALGDKGMRVRGTISMPNRIRMKSGQRGVSVKQMITEIALWSDDEISRTATRFAQRYRVLMIEKLQSAPKLKKQFLQSFRGA